MPGTSPGTPPSEWAAASPPRRPSPPAAAAAPALRPVVNTSMARAIEDEPKPAPTIASITESLSLLGLSPETLAMSFGESLADRYLAALKPKQPERPLGSCGAPRRTPHSDPLHLQLFSNDFIDYLNQIA